MMKYAVSEISVVPVRRQPFEQSEMVTQILFGEVVNILEEDEKKSWLLARCDWDGYLGWVSKSQLTEISQKEFDLIRNGLNVCAEFVSPALCDGDSKYLPFGASLPQFDEMTFTLLGKKYAFGGRVSFPSRIEDPHQYLRKLIKRMLHCPYQWGGRSPLGIDCSGLTQILYKHLGYKLPRDAFQQVEVGQDVHFISSGQMGDLAFFRNHYTDRISHVGLLLGDGQIVHASGRVRIDKIDHYGIYHHEEKRYTHLLVGIKRILPIRHE